MVRFHSDLVSISRSNMIEANMWNLRFQMAGRLPFQIRSFCAVNVNDTSLPSAP